MGGGPKSIESEPKFNIIYKFPARPANCFVRPGQARLEINILQNLYNYLNNFWRDKTLIKLLLSTGIICNLSTEQSQTC